MRTFFLIRFSQKKTHKKKRRLITIAHKHSKKIKIKPPTSQNHAIHTHKTSSKTVHKNTQTHTAINKQTKTKKTKKKTHKK